MSDLLHHITPVSDMTKLELLSKKKFTKGADRQGKEKNSQPKPWKFEFTDPGYYQPPNEDEGPGISENEWVPISKNPIGARKNAPSITFTVYVYYPIQFQALRAHLCAGNDDKLFCESLSRCNKWSADG